MLALAVVKTLASRNGSDSPIFSLSSILGQLNAILSDIAGIVNS